MLELCISLSFCCSLASLGILFPFLLFPFILNLVFCGLAGTDLVAGLCPWLSMVIFLLYGDT